MRGPVGLKGTNRGTVHKALRNKETGLQPVELLLLLALVSFFFCAEIVVIAYANHPRLLSPPA
jgi:hypothetical protein